jgi:hypothetical protein
METRTTQDLRDLWGPPCSAPLSTRLIAPGVRVTCHAKAVEAVRALAAVCQAHRYALRSDTGAYNCRRITGGRGYSLHAYGIALDLNWNSNPYRLDRLVTDMPTGMVDGIQAIRTVGGLPVWRWGGDWDDNPETGENAYDAMHFEVVASPEELAAGIDWRTVQQPLRDPQRPYTYPTIQVGDRGPAVEELQRRMHLPDDGVFGLHTQGAVATYQQARGLEADGVVGLQTWTALLTQQPKRKDGEPSPVKLPEPLDVEVPIPVLPDVRERPPLPTFPARPVPRPRTDLYPGPRPVPAPALQAAPERPPWWRRVVPSLTRSSLMQTLAKPWWQSKTVWFNLLAAVAVILGGAQELVEAVPLIPASVATVIGVLIAAVNFVLRFFTDRPVRAKQ